MPYIKKQYRELIKYGTHPVTSGELNYKFSMIIQQYLTDKGLCYKNINDILGALEGAKLEFYRRVVSPYEDKKIKENGDLNA